MPPTWADKRFRQRLRKRYFLIIQTAHPDAKAGCATRDLGRVETVATVFVNGRKVRTLWAPPYRCAVELRDGANDLRVEVANTWFNRLAYDSGLPEKDRKTWTIAPPKKGTPPEPAGLLGPVTIR